MPEGNGNNALPPRTLTCGNAMLIQFIKKAKDRLWILLIFSIGVAVVIVAIVVIYSILRNKKINDNGIEADAVISRIDIDTDVDGGVTENKTYYVDYQNAEGQTATAKLGNPPFGAAVGTAMRVKYLPEKPKYVSCVK